MRIYRSFDREDTPMGEMIDLPELVTRLVESAYPELNPSQIRIGWGRTSSFATVSWTQDFKDIRIKCSIGTKHWHEAALTGLLAHELSHPAQMKKKQSERSTDLDVVERGFGPFLGVERLFAGKYEDHIILKGKDRYLGYRSIRQLLISSELLHLDTLLAQLQLIPSTKVEQKEMHHDIVIIHSRSSTTIKIDGHEFEILSRKEDPEITLLQTGQSIHVIVDDEDVGSFDSTNA
ncbi:hypothetical protein E4H12_06565 [Candidatus Thorarchaeota archaeon]|nr:MAG: hypothetical protein E4H12_06565 [Candidatus Thorarchaeota archaeon]